MNNQTVAETTNYMLEEDMDTMLVKYPRFNELELDCANSLILLYNSAPAPTHRTPNNSNEQQRMVTQEEPKRTDHLPTVSTNEQRRSRSTSANSSNVSPISANEHLIKRSRSPTTQKRLSSCRNILTDYMRGLL